jgi:hypothetical protein
MALRYPQDMVGRQAEWARLGDFAASGEEAASLGVVWGRRRVGKSFLLESLVEQSGGFYGGVAAYAREMSAGDLPAGPDDFDRWVCQRVLSPAAPLFSEVALLQSDSDVQTGTIVIPGQSALQGDCPSTCPRASCIATVSGRWESRSDRSASSGRQAIIPLSTCA